MANLIIPNKDRGLSTERKEEASWTFYFLFPPPFELLCSVLLGAQYRS